MDNVFPPALILIIGALLIPFLKGHIKSAYMILLPIVAFLAILNIPPGNYQMFSFLGQDMSLRFDSLSLVFAYVFVIIACIANIYALHVKGDRERVAACIYPGAALGAVFAGDLITLFIFWEMMTFAALFIIWSNKTAGARAAGMRYLLMHLFGGLCLLTGIIMTVHNTGTATFGYIGLDAGLASWLILIGFAVNAVVLPFHAWLPDAYPEASITGAIFLTAFTTKTAVYVLARTFPGAEVLMFAGVAMALFGVCYAIIENNIRRLLSYHIVSQVGFMVAAVGVGVPLAINGLAAHAFAHVLYKGLLFMAIGAVLYRVGTAKASELGGLYRTMPLTALFCIIGAASISGIPFLSGFVSKSMTLAAAGQEGIMFVWLLLTLASVGTLLSVGFKVPYFTFFAKDSGKRPPEAPLNMLIVMGLAAFLCVFIGIYPAALYNILPYGAIFAPYTIASVTIKFLFAAGVLLAFIFLLRTNFYPAKLLAVNLDVDWFYRKLGLGFLKLLGVPLAWLNNLGSRFLLEIMPKVLIWFGKNPSAMLKVAYLTVRSPFNSSPGKFQKEAQDIKAVYPNYVFQPWSIGFTMAFITIFLVLYLIIYYTL